MTRSSKVVSFAPVKEPVISKDVGTSSIENTTNPIPAQRISLRGSKQHRTLRQSKPRMTKAAKQPQPRTRKSSKDEVDPIKPEANWAIDTSNIVSTSARVRRQLNNDVTHELPSLKRRRLARRQGQAQPVYSRKWHPIDDIVSPKRALKVKTKACSPRKANEEEGDFSDEREKIDACREDSDADVPDPPEEIEDNDDYCEVVPSIPRSPSPGRRSSCRTSPRAYIPNYDTKFHPAYDKACRPATAQAATLRQRGTEKPRCTSTDNNATLVEDGAVTAGHDVTVNDKGPTIAPSPAPKLSYSRILCAAIPELPKKSTHSPTLISRSNKALLSSPPPWSSLQNPYIFAEPLDYQKLELLDRLIYSIQKGAPSHSKTLPMTWQEVKRMLFDHGEITLDELNSEEGTEWLKARYESVRVGTEMLFDIKGSEPSNRNDSTSYHIEDFDIFDKQQGSRYWKHRSLSVVSPMAMRASFHETDEVAETDDERGHCRGGNHFKIYENMVDGDAVVPAVQEEASGSHEDDLEGSTIIDLAYARSLTEDTQHTLIENMRGKDVLASEAMMDEEELGNLLSPLSQYPEESLLSHLHSPFAQLIPDLLNDGQPEGVNKGPCREAAEPSQSTQPTTEPRLKDTIQPIINHYIADINRIARAEPTPTTTSKKRKSRPEPGAQVSIHEDLPGGTPFIRRLTANNPLSPGTDIPKENLYENGTVEHSSQVSTTTPRTTRRQRAVTTSPIPFRYVAYSSMFGGPGGPQSLGT
ncbi:hypothetical protein N7G274_007370 [Stereocaulon virgatum]|uniref:Uncharacterized protein n=1 Tax=Stereocaulon virgatum TaxID=373712 RepID=A0ABR4A1Z0_9LECA